MDANWPTIALRIAFERHSFDERKGRARLPYIIHPLDVVRKLGDWGIDRGKNPDVIAVAMLHDCLEDLEREEYDRWLGQIKHYGLGELIDFLRELTLRYSSGSKGLYTRFKAAYIESFKHKTIESLVIKVADRLANTTDFHNDGSDYAAKYYAKGIPLYEAVMMRREEIEARFGPETFRAITEDIGRVKIMVDN